MAKEKHQCSGRNKDKSMGFSFCFPEHNRCTSNGSLFENDKWWCKRHAPSIKEKKRKEYWGA